MAVMTGVVECRATPDLEIHLRRMMEAALAAGRLALENYEPGRRTDARIRWKDGGSPVTDVDLAADALIAEILKDHSRIPYHSEERPESWDGLPPLRACFVVDPIDGTRNFMEGGDAWCVTIGLLVNGLPAAGVVHIPARRLTFAAWRGGGAWCNGKPVEVPGHFNASPRSATGPRTMVEAISSKLAEPLASNRPIPALAHRVLAPLSGEADIAVARSGGHDWDILAADCILSEAGGALMASDGSPPRYHLDGGEHPPLVAVGPAYREKVRAALLTNPA